MYKMKKALSVILTFILSVIVMQTEPEAHVGDYFSGGYSSSAPSQPSYMQFMYSSSSTGGYYTSAVFSCISDWNSLSSNVTVSLTFRAPGMPSTITNQFYQIYNETMTNMYSFTFGLLAFGRTYPIEYPGSTNEASTDSDWYRVTVFINTASPYIDSTVKAKKVLLHEIGHCLKLSHPINDTSLHGTTYNGLPYAIMNQGIPQSGSCVAPSIQDHDSDNLRGKWGN